MKLTEAKSRRTGHISRDASQGSPAKRAEGSGSRGGDGERLGTSAHLLKKRQKRAGMHNVADVRAEVQRIKDTVEFIQLVYQGQEI